MAERRVYVSDGLFWLAMAATLAGAFGLGVSYAVAEVAGEGWRTGVYVGGLIFLVGFVILAIVATSANLPPPNTVKAPVAPPGGAFRAPQGGAYRMPGAPLTTARSAAPAAAPPAPAASLAEMSESAGEVVGKAAYSASAAVTSAAQAARDAIAGVLDTGSAKAAPDEAVDQVRPAALDGPRESGADDLKKIKGVGPKLEELLHSLGFYHFDQIAAWGPAEVAWVDSNLEGFNGRATRDEWVAQARLLAAGGETEFSQRVEKGDVY